MRKWLAVLLMTPWLASPALAHDSTHEERLPVIGEAPGFTLTSQDNRQISLADFGGKVVAVTFIYASCLDTCPLLTDKMARVQDKLGAEFGGRYVFVSITVDPERDTPKALKSYAESFGANPAGWFFLTGAPAAIQDIERRYGVVARKAADGGIDHTFLTSLIDTKGNLRIQYIGYRFDPEEFRRDLVSLAIESE